MELEILTEEEAVVRPAGVARNEPNTNPTLAPPELVPIAQLTSKRFHHKLTTDVFRRPDTSFNWFTNPWKVFKVLIWRRYKWHILIGLLLILLIVFAVLMFYTAPEAINDAIWN